MVGALMAHHELVIHGYALPNYWNQAAELWAQVIGEVFDRGRILRVLAEHGAVRMIAEADAHDCGNAIGGGCDVRFLRFRRDTKMSKLIRNRSSDADQHSGRNRNQAQAPLRAMCD